MSPGSPSQRQATPGPNHLAQGGVEGGGHKDEGDTPFPPNSQTDMGTDRALLPRLHQRRALAQDRVTSLSKL